MLSLQMIYVLESSLNKNFKRGQDTVDAAAAFAEQARSFVCGWLRDQMSLGRPIRGFRSPASHIIEDELMFEGYWFVICFADLPTNLSTIQSVSRRFPLRP